MHICTHIYPPAVLAVSKTPFVCNAQVNTSITHVVSICTNQERCFDKGMCHTIHMYRCIRIGYTVCNVLLYACTYNNTYPKHPIQEKIRYFLQYSWVSGDECIATPIHSSFIHAVCGSSVSFLISAAFRFNITAGLLDRQTHTQSIINNQMLQLNHVQIGVPRRFVLSFTTCHKLAQQQLRLLCEQSFAPSDRHRTPSLHLTKRAITSRTLLPFPPSCSHALTLFCWAMPGLRSTRSRHRE